MSQAAPNDIRFADFEGDDYGTWKTEGSAFGKAPARGALAGQMGVEGFQGRSLANSFNGGDGATGKLISPDFKIERNHILFLIGGGGYEKQTCLNLIIDGKTARSATGPNIKAGGSEKLESAFWDVSDLAGKTAHLEIVDAATGGWGHINVDEIVFTDDKPVLPRLNATREIEAKNRFLQLPVKNGGDKRKVTIFAAGKAVREFDIELADETPDWLAPLDVSAWQGQKLIVQTDKLPAHSRALELITQSDEFGDSYDEKLRPQLHFSARRGWLNDPNGLSFYGGEWHLFFQHNPYGWNWGNMHWGHATSRDLVHWQEQNEALYPDALGTMFSGSAVVDWKNSSGFGKNDKPPLVLLYTAAGNPFTQGLAYSNDGRTFTKYEKNPVVPNITGGNRDPKVIWHAPSQQWIMTLYVEKDGLHTIHFFASPNLRDWKKISVAEGVKGTKYLFECPDFFELPLDGNTQNKKWILTAANAEYAIGSFDGTSFTPEIAELPGQRGRGFYAAQTFSDAPDGRRIQIGWLQAPSPGMSFNQAMSLPLELTLVSTPEGPRLRYQVAREIENLRAKSYEVGPLSLAPDAKNPLSQVKNELLEIRATFKPNDAKIVRFTVRGVPIIYDAAQQEISVNGHVTPAPLRDGTQKLVIYTDRTAFEVFASDGLTYVPMPIISNAENLGVEVAVEGGAATFLELAAHDLKSIWGKSKQDASLKAQNF